jgi:hypothetical protein
MKTIIAQQFVMSFSASPHSVMVCWVFLEFLLVDKQTDRHTYWVTIIGTLQTCDFIDMCLALSLSLSSPIMGYINSISAVSASWLNLYLCRVTHQDCILLILFVKNNYTVNSWPHVINSLDLGYLNMCKYWRQWSLPSKPQILRISVFVATSLEKSVRLFILVHVKSV